MENKKIAIYQGIFGLGGRTNLLLHIVQELNRHGVTPDIYSYDFHCTDGSTWNTEVDFFPRKLTRWLPQRARDLNAILLNLRAKMRENQYDLFINSTNTTLFAPTKTPCINYIHFPRKARNNSFTRSNRINDSLYPSFSIGKLLKTLYRKSLEKIFSLESSPMGQQLILCNSNFTKKHITKAFGMSKVSESIKVLYPPVDLEKFWSDSSNRRSQVVTLGRFDSGKRQFDQIKIAKQLPNLEFHIIGLVKNPDYYNRCKEAIKSLDTKNVTLHANLPFGKVKEFLQRSLFFMHTMRREPFGISSVEAVAAGCIPVVHNSGGSREVVPIDKLRFDEIDEAVHIIKKHKDLTLDELAILRGKLQQYIERFDISAFIRNLELILSDIYD